MAVSARPPLAELSVMTGPLKDRVIPVDGEGPRVLGRQTGVDLHVQDASISRQHCRFEPLPGGRLRVVDLGSANGTTVNGRTVESAELSGGEIIGCGEVELLFLYRPTAAPEATPGMSSMFSSFSTEFSGSATTGAALSMDVGNDLGAAVRQRFAPRAKMYETPVASDRVERAEHALNAVCGLAEQLRLLRSPAEVIDASLDAVLALTGTNRAALVLRDRGTGEIRVVRTKSDDAGAPKEFQISLTVVREVLDKNESLLVRDTGADDRFKDGLSIIIGGIKSLLCSPLGDENSAFGAIYADTTATGRVLTETQVDLLAAVGHQAGVALERAWLVADLQRLFVGAMLAMVRTLEAKDAYTRGHTQRVMLLALQLADRAGVAPDERDALELGGLMHDVGKIGVRDDVLGKPGRLTDEEFDAIKKHPGLGALILGGMPNLDRLVSLESVIKAVRGHHERLDGKGYPDGLAGDAVPRSARLLAIADVWDALTTDRPYRAGMSVEDAWGIMEKGAGSQFDAPLLAVFKTLIDDGSTDNLSAVRTSFGLEYLAPPAAAGSEGA